MLSKDSEWWADVIPIGLFFEKIHFHYLWRKKKFSQYRQQQANVKSLRAF